MDDDDYLGAEALAPGRKPGDSADIVIGQLAGIGRSAPGDLPRPVGRHCAHRILLTTRRCTSSS